MLNVSFPRLKPAFGTETVLGDVVVGMLRLDRIHAVTEAEFLRLAAVKLRRTLLNLAKRFDRKEGRLVLRAVRGGSEPDVPAYDRAETTADPAKLAAWTEFHDAVANLPERERLVVDLYFYCGLPMNRVAEEIGVQPERARQLFETAIGRLPLLPE